MKMKKFAALAAATVMSVSAIAATSAFGVFATTDFGVNNIVIKDSDTNRVYKAYQRPGICNKYYQVGQRH